MHPQCCWPGYTLYAVLGTEPRASLRQGSIPLFETGSHQVALNLLSSCLGLMSIWGLQSGQPGHKAQLKRHFTVVQMSSSWARKGDWGTPGGGVGGGGGGGEQPRDTTPAPCLHRHWQDLGYLIIYVTGRPDMQKQRVVAWLAQHNFPHGVVSFCDGLVHDPLRHKANFLKLLISEVGLGRTG